MKAIAKVRMEPGIEVIDVDTDRISEDQVLLRMRSASICGSDLGLYEFAPAYHKFLKVPVILGHEFSGEIVEIGKNVSGYRVGERVVCESVIYCGECKYCRMGFTNICQNFTVFGVHRNGGFAAFVAVEPRFLHKIPSELSDTEAGIVEPLSVVVNALDDVADVSLGKTVAVIGPGPLGLMSGQVLKSKGLEDIFVIGIDIDRVRLEIARKLGFKTINAQEENPEKTIRDATETYGGDLVVVAAGADAALRSALSLVSKGGQVVVLALFREDVSIPFTDLVRKQVSILGSYASRWIHYERAISLLLHKQVNADAIVTHRFSLEEAEKAFETAKSKIGCKVQFYN